MVNKAKVNLASFENIFVIQSDIVIVSLPEKVNVIFSTLYCIGFPIIGNYSVIFGNC